MESLLWEPKEMLDFLASVAPDTFGLSIASGEVQGVLPR